MKGLLRVGLAVSALLAITAPVAATQAPIILEFEKAAVGPGHYQGTVEGGGTIEMWLFDSSVIGNTQHFSALVEVAGSTGGSFTAVVSGQINFSTGRVVLNGTVTGGSLAGARIHEESQLVGVDPFRFVGSVQVMPASSGGRS